MYNIRAQNQTWSLLQEEKQVPHDKGVRRPSDTVVNYGWKMVSHQTDQCNQKKMWTGKSNSNTAGILRKLSNTVLKHLFHHLPAQNQVRSLLLLHYLLRAKVILTLTAGNSNTTSQVYESFSSLIFPPQNDNMTRRSQWSPARNFTPGQAIVRYATSL